MWVNRHEKKPYSGNTDQRFLGAGSDNDNNSTRLCGRHQRHNKSSEAQAENEFLKE